MTPAAAIAMLDRQIARHGQTVKFKRASTPATMRSFVRPYAPDKIVGLVTEQDRLVILSPSTIGAYGVPKEQDDVSLNGQQGKVQPTVKQIFLDDTLVRIEMRVRIVT